MRGRDVEETAVIGKQETIVEGADGLRPTE